MLHLICGPSGSGKTACLKEKIRADIDAQKRCILLVPEQQDYFSEQDFAASLPESAGRFFEVASFSSLADAVSRLAGGVVQSALNPAMQTLLMWDTLRELSSALQQYSSNAREDGTLSALMIQTIDELRNNGITSEKLEEAAHSLPENSPLQRKLLDIAMVDSVYHQKLLDAFGEDPSDRLVRMAKKLEHLPYFADCHIYIDSFTSFTAQEYDVLKQILKQAACVTVTLCADSFTSRLPHFESVVRTANRLRVLATDKSIPIEYTVLTESAIGRPEALRVLERNLWRFDSAIEPKATAGETVTILNCTNLYEEAEAAALQILNWVQSGMLYDDIAVIVRDAEIYRGVLDAALERHKIPYFLSERTDLSAKPLVRLILSALRAITRNYHVKDIMTLAKTGLSGIDRKDIALFEEYCETWHISGSRFLDPVWSMNPDGLTTTRSPRAEEILQAANRVRQTLIEPLRRFATRMRSSGLVKDRCSALYDYLMELSIPETLSAQAKKEIEKGRLRQAGESIRLYRFLTDSLTQMVDLLPETQLSAEEFLSAISLLLSSSDLGSVPNAHDCVIIGSAATLRVENVRATILLGLCEGEFPRAITENGMLSESDKSILEGVGILLDSRESIQNSEELFYVYRAVTKPTEKLMISHPLLLPDGSAKTPSLAFQRIKLLLNCRDPETFDRDMLPYTEPASARSDSGKMSIEPAAVGTNLRLSQSKIRTFVLCPYSYYSTYQLHLREKKDSTPSYADDGTFLHHVFEKLLRASLSESGTFRIPAWDDAQRLADEIIEGYLGEVCPIPQEDMDRRLLHLFSRLRKLALRMLEVILEELRNTSFTPFAFEQVIGKGGPDGLPPVTLTMKDGSTVTLSGKIDRVDVLHLDGKHYLRVVDYKSSKHSFAIEDVRSGLDIQLVLYLVAALSSNPSQYTPAGAQFLYAVNEKGKIDVQRSGFFLDSEEVCKAADLTKEKQFIKKLSLQSADEINTLAESMKDAVRSVAERILRGEADKTPSKEACMFCPVREHCDRAYHE